VKQNSSPIQFGSVDFIGRHSAFRRKLILRIK
jgi:hypothetical protein